MALFLSEEQLMLMSAAAEYFAENSSVDTFRKVRDESGVVGISKSAWQEVADLGWGAIVVPESLDGLDFGLTGLGLLCIEAARKLAVSPLQVSAGLAINALLKCEATESRDALIRDIASGEKVVNYVAPQNAPLLMNEEKIMGALKFVAEAAGSDLILTPVAGSENTTLALIALECEGLRCEPVNLMDHRDYANLHFDGVEVSNSESFSFSGSAAAAIESLDNLGALLTACELYGLSREVFQRTLEYLKEREQFDQKIGAFQALQHRMAKAYMQLEMLKSVVYDALDAMDAERDDQSIAVSHAKTLANDASQLITTEAIQMHGGMGITDELDIGLFYKRARVLRTVYGSSSYHKQRFARLSGY